MNGKVSHRICSVPCNSTVYRRAQQRTGLIALLLTVCLLPQIVAVAQEEIILDNGDAGTEWSGGKWNLSGSSDSYGTTSQFEWKGDAEYQYDLTLQTGGSYEVHAWWTTHEKRRTDVPYKIQHSEGTSTVRVNQRENGGQWNLLGSFVFEDTATVRIVSEKSANSNVCADAIRFVLIKGTPNEVPEVRILALTPNPAFEGDVVIFEGEVNDPNDGIATYEWSSDLDGLLSTSADFSTNALTPGTHEITLRAQSEDDVWSTRDRMTLEYVADADGDRVADDEDNCPQLANADQVDSDTDGVGDACQDSTGTTDTDEDGTPDHEDNCPNDFNKGQADHDDDGLGGPCDPDNDNDTILDEDDNCRNTVNPDQADSDFDGIGDACEDEDEPVADGDQDGVDDSQDNCREFHNPQQEDLDADGLGDLCDDDSDGDGVGDDNDNCPRTENADQADIELDGKGDACDNCPISPNAGQQDSDADGVGDGCDRDIDGDGVDNSDDNCPFTSNPTQDDADDDGIGNACDPSTGTDTDLDGFLDSTDNCPLTANFKQRDLDKDGIGNACDADDDSDGFADEEDNCDLVVNPSQEDTDGDGLGDACDDDDDGDGISDETDNCLTVHNPSQEDTNGDGLGNDCDATYDADFDGIPNTEDNCPASANADQADENNDGVGDACQSATVMFVRGDSNRDGILDLSDSIHLLNYLFRGQGTLRCYDAADANDDSRFDLGDPIYLIRFIFGGGTPPPMPYPAEGDDLTSDGLPTCSV